MTDVRNEADRQNGGSKADHETAPRQELERMARRPYHQPHLRHLGSVRELTAGGGSPINSDGSGFKGKA
jgi:hypothetical protein